MTKTFLALLADGGKTNSLGRSGEVISAVLQDRTKLSELYDCLFVDDAWVRMRAIDAIEKIGRVKPEWLLPYIDKIQSELHSFTQPSIQWHIAQIYRETDLNKNQKTNAIFWLKHLLKTTDVDWIVSVNVMKTIMKFTNDGTISGEEATSLFKTQQGHKSKTVKRIASKLLIELQTK